MSEFTKSELDELKRAIEQPPPTDEERESIPLRPPGNYVSHVALSPLDGEMGEAPVTSEVLDELADCTADVEVAFGTTRLTLKQIAALDEGSVIPFDQLVDELLDVYIEGKCIGRGEIVAADGHFGIKLASLS